MATGDEAAIERYQRYLEDDPANTLLLLSLGDLHHRAGHLQEAAACYERSLAISGSNAVARSRLAAVLISQHRFAEAEAALAPLTESEPDDASLWHNLGLARYFQKRWREALDAFERAQTLGLDLAENFAYLTYAYHHLGATEKARALASKWLQRAPTAATRGYVALLEMDAGNMEAAAQQAEAVLAEMPDNTDAGVVVGMWSIEHQDMERARVEFERVTRAEPDNPRAWLGFALMATYLQQHDDALAAFERTLALMPANVGITVAYAWEKYAAKDIPGAESMFRKAVEIDRNFGEAHGGLAAMLVMQNRREEARREIELARRLAPEGFGWVYAQSVLLALEGQRARGEKILAGALDRSLRPGGPTLMENIRVFLDQQARRAPPNVRKLPRR